MSLTSFLKNKEVRDKFQEEFPKPRFTEKKELLAPPLTQNWSAVGIAFDYLLRFYLKRLNPKAVESRWVAEVSPEVLFEFKQGFAYNVDTDEIDVVPDLADQDDEALFNEIKRTLSEARNRYQAYLKTGKISKPLLTSALFLANLDIIVRTGLEDYIELDTVSDEDIKDLVNLIGIIDSNLFKTKNLCLLNPTFGKASTLVGGADADLVIDDTLVEIKTTQKLQLRRDHYNQLIGYYTLYKIGGIKGSPAKHKIKNIGIYFSRYGYFHRIPVKDHINKESFPAFLEWFKEKAQTA